VTHRAGLRDKKPTRPVFEAPDARNNLVRPWPAAAGGAVARGAHSLLARFGLIAAAVLCVLPAMIIVVGGLSEGNPFNNFHASLDPWARAIVSSQTLRSIEYSFLVSLRVPVGLFISFVIAWYLARNDVFGKRTIMYTLWLAFFLPILPATLGWILLLDPNYGLINALADKTIHIRVLNIYSLAGIIWVHLTLSTIPIMVVLIEPAQRLIDTSYEEASTVSGAGIIATLGRVTVPLLAPTLITALIAGTIKSLEAFEVEQVLGVPAGIFVYSTRIYNLLRVVPPDEPQAMALSTFFLTILFALVLCYRILLQRANMAATLTGKGARLIVHQRTRQSYAVSALLFAALAVTVLLPFSMVALSSFSALFGFFNLEHPWTTAHWTLVLGSPTFMNAFHQSLIIGVALAIGGTALYLGLAWSLARNSFRGKSAISLAIWMPWAIPGVLLGTAFLTLFLNVPGLRLAYGTPIAMIVVLLVQGLPFATHMFEASISQISQELEEASLVSGAAPLETLLRITIPLIAPMIASVFIISFMTAMKDISATVLVATPGTQTLPLLMFSYTLSGRLEDASVIAVVTVLIATVMAFIVMRVGDRAAIMAQVVEPA
jgi:iron(III) transport system permease protein